jgi:DNA polymerase-1
MSENLCKQEKKRVLIIDGNNNYFRAYIVDPSVSTNGQPIGGIKGFLKILQKLCREIKPNRVVICWDGNGGSTKRKLMNKGYKDGRKPIRLNRNIRNLSDNEEIDNKIWQMTRLAEYINEMPVIQLLMDGVEADDLISCVVQHRSMKNYNKVIVSSDKDFIQLCDDTTILYRPVQQQILNKKSIVDEYGIHPNNFCLARALSGDKSDNLEGVEGVGLATVAKRFSMLSEEKIYTIDDIVKTCQETDKDVKAYKSILEQISKVKDNYQIMQLGTPNISVQDSMKIDYALENSECTFNKMQITKMMIQDGFGEFDASELFLRMKMIQLENC